MTTQTNASTNKDYNSVFAFKPFTKQAYYKPRITRRVYKTKNAQGIDTYALDITVTGHNSFRMTHLGAHLTREIRRQLKQKQPTQIFENSDPDFESQSSDLEPITVKTVKIYTIYFDVNLEPMFCVEGETNDILYEKDDKGQWTTATGRYGFFDENECAFKVTARDKNISYFRVDCYEEPHSIPDINLSTNTLYMNGHSFTCTVHPTEETKTK